MDTHPKQIPGVPEKNFSICSAAQFCSNLTSCEFLAVWGKEGSDRNVGRDLKLTKNVSSLKYDLPCPYSFLLRKQVLLLSE